MSSVSDQYHFIAVPTAAGDLEMYLCDKWAGGVEYTQLPLFSLFANRLGDAVGTEYHSVIVRYIVQFVNENGTSGTQAFDHKSVVYNLVAHIDGCPQELKGPLDDFDRPVDAGTEASGIGE
jgi:hypothetical protein